MPQLPVKVMPLDVKVKKRKSKVWYEAINRHKTNFWLLNVTENVTKK